MVVHNILVSPYLISLYRECLITFGFPCVHDIVLFGRLDGTSPKDFVPPQGPYTLGRIKVTGNPISSTLNGQTNNIFYGKPVINPYWLSSNHQRT